MTQWILAAEADKIQDLIFRSAHLQEVVGGSQLLTRFCREGAPALLANHTSRSLREVQNDILVADGGSFSILFDDEGKARRYGRALAQLYRRSTGGTLTVAEPVPVDGDFAIGNDAARQALRLAKDRGSGHRAGEHLPYAAFCASCGVGLAFTHEPLHAAEQANYLCRSCRTKADARQEAGSEFLLAFKREVVGGDAHAFDWPTEADDLAEGWDPRNYVAYLVADGNGMGKVFDKCQDPKILRRLSERLTDELRASLAEPTRLLMRRAPESGQRLVPALPLILGGDDVFVLLPAPYALDFARRFCVEYEQRMKDALQELGLEEIEPTMAAAVVICKSKYPYTLAHRRGDELLEEAKRLSKAVALEGGGHSSTVNFDLILGSSLTGIQAQREGDFRATLRPYWVVTGKDALSAQLGLSLQALLDQRYRLRGLPARRLAQLRALFAPEQIPSVQNSSLGRWQARLEQVKARIARSRSQREALDEALGALGGQAPAGWYDASRPAPRTRDATFQGHGLPDLLEMWDFALDLDRDRSEYEWEESWA